MNYGKRLKQVLPSRSESEYSLGDDFDDDGKSCKSFFSDDSKGMSGSKDTTDRVSRNLSEKKRRDQFNMLVNELCSMVSTSSKKMDKSTVLKSTIAYLKTYQETAVQAQAHEIKEDWKPSFLSNDEFMHLMLEALDSCLLVFTQQGNILYVSESMTSLLGHLPADLTNQSVYNYIHENEKQNLYNILFHYSMLSPEEHAKEKDHLSFTCHFKRGSISALSSLQYEVVSLSGFQHWSRDKLSSVEEECAQYGQMIPKENSCFCCTVRLQSSQFIREMSMVDESKTEFMSRHSLEWKFLFLDHRASPIIGYLPFEVLGTSGYDYYHPDDLEQIASSHEQLMQTGEGTSSYYRFLTKGQQWIWIKTRYYITYHQWNSKPEFIVCNNAVVSYADVREQVHKDLGIDLKSDNSNSSLQFQRSPSVCSVTSGGRSRSNWSSSHSIDSASTDQLVSGNQMADKESVEEIPSHITKDLPSTMSPHKHLQLLLQQRYLNQATASDPKQLQRQVETATSTQNLLSVSEGQAVMSFRGGADSVSSTSQIPVMQSGLQYPILVDEQKSPSQNSQLFLTPIQKQLHEQLREKSKKLQQAILQQQEELQQITRQLAMTQQGILPLPDVPNPGTPVLMTLPAGATVINTAPVNTTGFPMQTSVTPALPKEQQQYIPFQLMSHDSETVFSYTSD
ncbi:circadian locomoter output cycles protein kaput-like isoform X1 [Ostrea edulis]|uniref:circadian locomoter output cycles protein kaput-like isoform X1 n=2 Tax=Ostrea edulis TaxID=37623 RepID=UPI00209551AC|nr:circadian locomoter output cycles protein kaput-like isoform X1 [Ostrea edulis]